MSYVVQPSRMENLLPAHRVQSPPMPWLPLTTRARATVAAHVQRVGDVPARVVVAGVGFVPVTLIAGTCFGVADLRTLALIAMLPALIVLAGVAVRLPWVAPMALRAVAGGMLATALYDLFRFGFLWADLLPGDPIPHIGQSLGLHPDWVAGYGWRYLLNGTGLALAFLALGLRGVRAGLLFGTSVAGGLLATLVVSPYGTAVLFPLTPAAIVMAIGGHLIYGAVLGALTTRRPVN